VLAVAGPRVWRILSFPLLYLFLAVPFGDALLPWLRGIASHAIVVMLEAGGVPAVLDGYLIRLPNADYRVADACSGLRFLLVSLAAGVLAIHLLLRSWRRRLLLLGVAAILPIAANALRSAILIWLAARGWLDPQSAAMHLTYGLGLTGILLALLMLLAWCLREPPALSAPAQIGFASPGAPLKMLAGAGAVALFAVLPITLMRHEAAAGPAHLPEPRLQGEWRSEQPGAELLERAAAAGAGARLAAAWRNETARVELLLLYYARERQGAEAAGGEHVPPSASTWTDVGVKPIRLNLKGEEIGAPESGVWSVPFTGWAGSLQAALWPPSSCRFARGCSVAMRRPSGCSFSSRGRTNSVRWPASSRMSSLSVHCCTERERPLPSRSRARFLF
jgi:exosortase/archaeosortase family protein